MAAHVNYVGYGNGPFAYLLDAAAGDALYVTMANGDVLAYTVKSVTLHHLATVDMDAIVFATRWTTCTRSGSRLIAAGGTFIPAATGGEYDSPDRGGGGALRPVVVVEDSAIFAL